jgi:hypothetical protein
MEPRTEPPPLVQLGYRSGREQPQGPTATEILVGLLYILLALGPGLMTGAFGCFAVAMLFGRGAEAGIAAWAAPAAAALLTGLVTFALLKLAWSCFTASHQAKPEAWLPPTHR